MGLFYLGTVIVGIIAGLSITAVTGGIGMFLAALSSRTRAGVWRFFVTTWALLLILCVLLWFGVFLPTFPSVSGGYDKMDKHLETIYAVFMHGFSLPGICALLVGASTFLISKRQPPMLAGATRGSRRRMSCSSHLLAALVATAGLVLVGWLVYGPARLGSASQARWTPPAQAQPVQEQADAPLATALSALGDAAMQVWKDDAAGYEADTRKMLAWAADTQDTEVAACVAKIACLRSIQDPEIQQTALALARKTLELRKEDRNPSPWHQLTLGMAEYRSGHFAEAEATLNAVPSPARRKKQHLKPIKDTANFYRAMCLFQLGRTDEARALHTATEAEMNPFPADEQNLLENRTHFDDLILWLACREAKALLAGSKEN